MAISSLPQTRPYFPAAPAFAPSVPVAGGIQTGSGDYIPTPPQPGVAQAPDLNLMRPFDNRPAPEIEAALAILGITGNLPADEAYMRQLGLDPIFHDGAEALKLIQDHHIKVEFGDMGDTSAHAQWIQEQNTIMINQKYKGDLSVPTLYAIAAAIYHEAGHAARLGDNQTSIQEELNCLALNTMAYRYHTVMDPAYATAATTSRLINDGVALYPKLFFDVDPYKQALINRVIEKYGQLPEQSPDNLTPPSRPGFVPLAERIVRQIQAGPPQPALSVMA